MSKKQLLFKRIRFTLLILVLYRMGTYIPLPFIDFKNLAKFLSYIQSGFLGMLNTFSGGSMSRVSILGLGIMPYISSSIVIQLLSASTPALKSLKEEGEAGRVKLNFYIKLLTLFIGFIQGMVLSSSFVSMGLYNGTVSLIFFKVSCAFIMMVSTMLLIWLADLCSANGIGNGTSLIIFTGIVAEMPRDIGNIFTTIRDGSMSSVSLLILFLVFLLTIAFVVLLERSNRLLLIQYPRQPMGFMGRKANTPKDNFLPLKINNAGVVPPIFASAVLLLPISIVSAFSLQSTQIGSFILSHFVHGNWLFVIIYSILILFFSFFYNTVIFDTKDIAKNLKKSNIFIPGCRPGEKTEKLLTNIMFKLSFIGGFYLLIICLIPELLTPVFGYSFLLGGTSVLIIVNVIVDTIIGIQTASLSNKYNKIAKRYDK